MVMARPEWLKIRSPDVGKMQEIKRMMDQLQLHTVCESAHCPNVGECFGNKTATFMIMGDVCTRNCAFCAVHHGKASSLDQGEPDNLATAVALLKLQHIVITSVTRDDLPDGGASHFAAVVRAVQQKVPESSIEVLIPDLAGNEQAIATIVAAKPHVLNHNVETVPSLYSKVRPQADYERSINLFRQVKHKDPGMVTKSGLMLGLGETMAAITAVMKDLQAAGCEILTLGQYLRPSPEHIPMERYITPEEFAEYRRIGLEQGFHVVLSNPLVRSSYYAREAYREAIALKQL
jgi:lipoic acid synthetase